MSDVGEQWRPVNGAIGYQVSDRGNVASVKSGARRLIYQSPDKRGYRRVSFSVDGHHFTRTVHSLVLEAFVGPRPAGMVCRHFPDRDPGNNALSNLQWGTYKQNSADRLVHGTAETATYSGYGGRLREERRRLGLSSDEVAERVGIKRANLRRYERGESEPSLTVADKLCKLLGRTLEYLYTGRESEFSQRDLDRKARFVRGEHELIHGDPV